MDDLAISCHDVWKSYRIYHQRSHSLKERVLSRRNMYEDFWALQGIDLEVRTGSSMGIIGPNGSGKSTLLKTLARILSPNRGTVEVRGTVSPLLELGTGFHPELTGVENVYMAGSLLGQTRRDIASRYDEIVEFAGIEDFMDTPVKNYSSGMYARLAFAVAISVDPEILIVDEVLSVGDEAFQLRCHERIGQLRNEGRTIVLVSHSLPTVRALCSDALWIDHGTVQQVGRAAEVVAGYLSEVHGDGDEHDGLRATGRRYGTGQAEITDVAIVDGEGKAVTEFQTGDPLVLLLSYRATDVQEDDLVCGVSVFRADNFTYVFGQNTVQAGIVLTASGEGGVEFSIANLPLLKGHYFLNLALHDRSGLLIYDCQDRCLGFTVIDNPTMPIEGGLVHVPSSWRSWETRVPA